MAPGLPARVAVVERRFRVGLPAGRFRLAMRLLLRSALSALVVLPAGLAAAQNFSAHPFDAGRDGIAAEPSGWLIAQKSCGSSAPPESKPKGKAEPQAEGSAPADPKPKHPEEGDTAPPNGAGSAPRASCGGAAGASPRASCGASGPRAPSRGAGDLDYDDAAGGATGARPPQDHSGKIRQLGGLQQVETGPKDASTARPSIRDGCDELRGRLQQRRDARQRIADDLRAKQSDPDFRDMQEIERLGRERDAADREIDGLIRELERCVREGAPAPRVPYALPPVAGLPGPSSEAWSDVALDFIAIFNVAGIGEVMLDRFFEAGGHFEVVPGSTRTSTDARYNTDEDRIKLGTNAFNADGTISRTQPRSVVAVFAHEFAHAYVDQVVNQGFDPATQQVLQQGANWLGQQSLRQANAQGSISAGTPAQAGSSVLDTEKKRLDFIEEYTGLVINRMVAEHLRIAKQLSDGEIDAQGAEQAWQRFRGNFAGEQITAYEDADSGEYRVEGGPPGFLTDHVANLFGLGHPPPTQPAPAPAPAPAR